jgi:ABC-type branched-subunit amino acid transport system ATPase component
MTLLDVRELAVHFGAVHACDGIDLRIDQGELVCIVGPNGSGKTTLFRTICGDIRATGGQVLWQGRDITRWPTNRIAQLGLVRTFQQSMVFPSATVHQNLRMAKVCAGRAQLIGRQENSLLDIPTEPDDVLDFSGLGDVAHTLAGALSTGWLRVLGIALTLVAGPSMIMLDEPAAGLNVNRAVQILALLRRVNAAGITLAVVDHDMSFILPLCRRLIVLDAGRKLMEGDPVKVAEHEDVVRVYLGGRFAQGKTGVTVTTEPATNGSAPATTPMDEPALQVHELSVRFGGVRAVTEASLKVEAGEVVGVLGPNGAGKSALLKCIVGAVPASGGHVRVAGRDVTGLRPDQILRRGLAHVLEGRHVFGAMTVDENLRLGATICRDAQRVEEDVQRLYDTFPVLAAKRRQRAMFLSGGQQQALVIGRALLSRPKVLLLDEPSLGLAPITLDVVSGIITWAHEQLGIAVVMVEQHTSLALAVAQRCYVMVRGRVVLESPSKDLLDGSVLRSTYLGAGVLA